MVAGYFSEQGLPYVKGQLYLPRLGVAGEVNFLVDTGSVSTVLHPADAVPMDCPFDRLVLPVTLEGVGSVLTYYRETAQLTLGEGSGWRPFSIEVSIAKPDTFANDLDSLLGRDVLNRIRMDYDFPQNLLQFV